MADIPKLQRGLKIDLSLGQKKFNEVHYFAIATEQVVDKNMVGTGHARKQVCIGDCVELRNAEHAERIKAAGTIALRGYNGKLYTVKCKVVMTTVDILTNTTNF